jgi:U3 small nucleolar RNA-associated protein 10
MLPFLTSLLDARDGNGKLLQQSALVAIESIARALCLGTVPMMRTSQVEQLSTAISKSADLIQAEIDAFDGSSVSFEGISRSSRQVVCSAALCASTCIRACGPRSLASLPKLMNPLTSFLSAANRFLSTCSADRTEQGQAKMMQMSILRSIIAVTETLPQFLAPYLKDLFNPFGLPSGWLRKDVDDQSVSVMNTAESLDEILVLHVPARLLIPAASQSLVTNQYDSTSLLSLLSLLTASTNKSKGSELSGHATTLLHVVTHVFESFDNADDREVVFSASSELFLALVLKLSEVQLRSLYVRLRDWRGDFDKLNPNRLASRRAAFWDLSASLGKQLRSIYLPCLATVFSDVVDELVSGGTAFSIFL